MSAAQPECPKPLWDSLNGQICETNEGEGHWRVSDLLGVITELKLEPEDYPIKFFNFSSHAFCANSLWSFARHMKQCQDADLSQPLIFAENGQCLDGQHRIVKALVEGVPVLKRYVIPDHVKPTA